jgi:hypothetical protein
VTDERDAAASLKSGDVKSDLAGILKRGGLAAIHARGDRLEVCGEQRCGNCIGHGIYPKRLIAKLKIDSAHASQGLPEMVLSSPPGLPTAACEHCGRTYFVEPPRED